MSLNSFPIVNSGFRQCKLHEWIEVKNYPIIMVLIFLCLSNTVVGQEWAPLGARWYYDQIEFSGDTDRSFIKFSVIGDATVEDRSVKEFERTFTTYLSHYDSILITKDTCYFSRIDDAIYFYDKNSESFKFTYDYAAQPGDTLGVWCSQGDTSIEVIVDSLSSIYINGFELRKFYVRSSFPQDCDMNGEIIENIGWTGYMFPQHSFADPPIGGPLRCYSDPIIGEFRISEKDCDFIVPTIDSELLGVKIYPNPCSEVVWVEDRNSTIHKISIVDINGRVLRDAELISNRIDPGDLSEGIYFIRIVTKKGTVGYRKLIKNSY